MGGNATAYIKSSNKSTKAQKIPIAKIGRKNFVNKLRSLFIELDKRFFNKYKKHLWSKEDIESGYTFNGSTGYIMAISNPKYPDAEIEKYKPTAGDVDIAVDETVKDEFIEFMEGLEDQEIVPGIRYMGKHPNSLSDQINTVFLINFNKDLTVACQIDFEFLPFENGKQSERSKISHYSSFDDTKMGVKGVCWQFVLRSMYKIIGLRPDIVIATSKSTPEKVTISKSKTNEIPSVYKYSPSVGVRIAYEPMLDKNGKMVEVEVDGEKKKVFKSIPTKESKSVSGLMELAKLAFGIEKLSPKEREQFLSMIGLCKLIKKYYLEDLKTKPTDDAHRVNLDGKTLVKLIQKRFEELLWGVRENGKGEKHNEGQEIEMDNPEADYAIKIAGYKKFIEILKLPDHSKALAKEYYSNWKKEGDASKVLEKLK